MVQLRSIYSMGTSDLHNQFWLLVFGCVLVVSLLRFRRLLLHTGLAHQIQQSSIKDDALSKYQRT